MRARLPALYIAYALTGCGRIGFDAVGVPQGGDGGGDAGGGPPVRLSAPNGAPLDEFGHFVAMSADGSTIAVAARRDDALAMDSGAAYIFVATGDTWTLQATLKAAVHDVDDQLGVALAISGDGNTVALGETNEDSGSSGNPNDNSAPDSGAVLVFVRSGSTWSQHAYIKANIVTPNDAFGTSVALSGTGDTLAIGARTEDFNANDSGAVYVYSRTGSTWSSAGFLKAASPGVGDGFGAAVALSDDGLTVAGAAVNDDGNRGTITVFHYEGGGWVRRATLQAQAGASDDELGGSLALSPSGARLLAGANGHDASVNNGGAAFVFERNGSTWTERTRLLATNTEVEDHLGFNVAFGDPGTAIVGAELANRAGFADTGAVYVFTAADPTWVLRGEVALPATVAGEQFGDTIAASHDGRIVAIGARGDDGQRGAVYVYRELQTR